MNRFQDLRFPTSFARLWCKGCEAETIHHKNRCGCGKIHEPESRVDKPPQFLAGANAKVFVRRKA